MSGTAPVSVIVLARTAGPEATRAIASAQAHAGEVLVIVSSEHAARELETRHPDVTVSHRGFRNPAEALTEIKARHEHRFWYWAEEEPDPEVWNDVARIARSSSPDLYEFDLAQRCHGHVIASSPPHQPAARLWHGPQVPLMTDAHGIAVPTGGLKPRRGHGTILHHGFGGASDLVARIDYEIGCAIHAAVDRGLTNPPEAIGAARLFVGWLNGWLRSGVRHTTARLVATFLDRFWVPLFLNARLREAAGELGRQGRVEWLDTHAEFDGWSA